MALTTLSRVVVPVSLGEDSSSSSQTGLSSGLGDTAKDTATAPLLSFTGICPLWPTFNASVPQLPCTVVLILDPVSEGSFFW